MSHQGPGRFQKLLSLTLTLLIIWLTIPEDQRRLAVMRAARAIQRAAGRAARHEGHAGMGNELAGRPHDAARRYSAAYSLARVRDRAAAAYGKMRP